MKALLVSFLALLSFVLTASIHADDAGMARVYLRDLEQQVAVAKEKTDAPYAWQQCEQTLQSLEDLVAKLPVADQTVYRAKIQEYKPAVTTGAARNRANIIVRR